MEAASEAKMIEQFRQMPTGWITDALGRLKLSGMSEGIYPISRAPQARRLAGRAVTVQYLPKRGTGPKVPNHYATMREIAKPGEVLVIAALGTPCWLLGENQAHVGMYRGLAGICVDGCVRDADEIAELPFPVFARGGGIRPYMSHLDLAGVNVNVNFAGAQVRPNDVVVADADGLIVVPGDMAEEVLENALEIAGIEKEMEETIKRKGTLKEIADLSARKKVAIKR
jgi:regulator of RNase E activity RraA